MAIELPKEARAQAVASIERWFQDERGERVGNITASALLCYFLEEIGPSIYNQAVADVQERLAQRVAEVDVEVHEDEFGYWRKFDAKSRGKR
jgi:uncharacterized protein (DUF2164 family)